MSGKKWLIPLRDTGFVLANLWIIYKIVTGIRILANPESTSNQTPALIGTIMLTGMLIAGWSVLFFKWRRGRITGAPSQDR